MNIEISLKMDIQHLFTFCLFCELIFFWDSKLMSSPALLLHSFALAQSFRSSFLAKASCSELNDFSSVRELAVGSGNQRWLYTSSVLLVVQHCQD